MESKTLFCLIVFVALGHVATSNPTKGQCNNSPQLVLHYRNGDPVSIAEDSPGLNNPTDAISFCVSGVWIFYDAVGYVGTNSRVVSHFDSLRCGKIDVGPFYVRSSRIAGLRPDNSVPSVTFFSNYNFGDERLVFGDSASDVEFPLKSYITINVQEFEVFEHSNFEGESVCIEDTIERDVKLVWWFGRGFLPWKTDPKSARIGCSPSAKRIQSFHSDEPTIPIL